jgi:hypothetical protein
LGAWQAQHGDLTARLVQVETEIDDRVYRLFGLDGPDRSLLSDHARNTMTDYPHGLP